MMPFKFYKVKYFSVLTENYSAIQGNFSLMYPGKIKGFDAFQE